MVREFFAIVHRNRMYQGREGKHPRWIAPLTAWADLLATFAPPEICSRLHWASISLFLAYSHAASLIRFTLWTVPDRSTAHRLVAIALGMNICDVVPTRLGS